MIDFVGQEGPVSKSRLIALDLLVLTLQLLVFAAFVERQNLKAFTMTHGAASNTESNPQTQDHDSEERGILRSDPSISEGIELQPLHSSSGRTGGEEDGERDELLSQPPRHNVHDSANHPLDVFYTGEHAITDLHVLNSIRSHWRLSDVSGSSDSGPSAAATAASLASRGLGVRMRIGGRELGSS